VQSEETRLHLRDAHERVMSLASVQQQLRASRLGDRIEVGPYLSKLCDSLAASMIGDRRPLALTVEAGDGTAESGAAVSIGLIITELVINALKHAFPPGRQGEISVRYEAREDDWRLSVSDNGIGRQDLHERAHSGLGTSIVEALARQLYARVELSSGPQGTIVAIVREARDTAPAGAMVPELVQ
jgi:two-component sensor histidine kinase